MFLFNAVTVVTCGPYWHWKWHWKRAGSPAFVPAVCCFYCCFYVPPDQTVSCNKKREWNSERGLFHRHISLRNISS